MAGAYVAKPPIVVTPVVPPGWNINWPFPGPFPPGFDPDIDWPAEGEPGGPGENGNISIVAYPDQGLETHEAGGEAKLWVFLKPVTAISKNKHGITVPIYPAIAGEFKTTAFGEIATISFAPGEVRVPKLVVVCGKNDEYIDGNTETELIIGPSKSVDLNYGDMFGNPVGITNKEIVNKIVFGLSIIGYDADFNADIPDCEDTIVVRVSIFEAVDNKYGYAIGYITINHTDGEVKEEYIENQHANLKVEFDAQSFDIRITASNLANNGVYGISVELDISQCKNELNSSISTRSRCFFYYNDVELEDTGIYNLEASTGQILLHNWLILNQLGTTPETKLIKSEPEEIDEVECEDCCCVPEENIGDYIILGGGVVIGATESPGEGWINAQELYIYGNMPLAGQELVGYPPESADSVGAHYIAFVDLLSGGGQVIGHAEAGASQVCEQPAWPIIAAKFPVGLWQSPSGGFVGNPWRYGYVWNVSPDNCKDCTDEPIPHCSEE